MSVFLGERTVEEELNPFSIFPSQEEIYRVHTEVSFSDSSILKAFNTREILSKHLTLTGGKVRTRFPPKPNGCLHIGHAKAMFVDFGLAKATGGQCYLRYDDTDPEAEKKEYIDHIQEIVRWMGWEPFKVTCTSDYFQVLYDLAVELIRRGYADVDHQFTSHPRAGNCWYIYPSYDYAHCILDSLENITHSFCTLEFETRRASYYWLLHSLGLYMPYVREYSLLNVTHTVLSKRKLNCLVSEKYVDGWDDPRLMTLSGLCRRGVSATAINTFIREIGVTRSDGSLIRLERLGYYIREEVVITNLEPGKVIYHDAKKWPGAEEGDTAASYKMKDSKDYYGLAPNKSVCLRYGYTIKCTDVILGDDNETVVEVHAEYHPEDRIKRKGVLHWVAEPSPGVDPLKNPAVLDNWLGDLNPNSKVVIPETYAVPSLSSAVLDDKFQFERLGYFAVDKDSTPDKLVFNRIATLRESYARGGK